MPETTVQAIVLRRRDSGESDRRLTLLTVELGKVDAVAKGARKSASRLAGISDPLSMATLTLAVGKVNRFITQAQPLASFRGLRTDYERLTFGIALAELYAAVLPWEQAAPEAHELLVKSLRYLETHPKPLVALLWAEARLMDLAGFLPQFDSCVVTGAVIVEGEPFVSPQAGGYVSDPSAGPFVDRFRTRAEALYALSRLPAMDEPPSNIRFAEEALACLFPFWRSIAEMQLPANEGVVKEVRHR